MPLLDLCVEVECDAYCASVIRARVQDGLASPGLVHGDIEKYEPQGHERECDGIQGGFPCQDSRFHSKSTMYPIYIECWQVVLHNQFVDISSTSYLRTLPFVATSLVWKGCVHHW